MTTPFKKLLYRYQNNLATDEEKKELMEMIHSGLYDKDLEGEWDKIFMEFLEDAQPEPIKYERQLQKIRRGISIKDEGRSAKIKKLQSSKIIAWAAASAAIILAILAGIWEWGLTPAIQESKEIVSEVVEERTFVGKEFVKLPDGSTVLLNEHSELRYRSTFGHQTREVYLKGEAFFDIARDSSKPFLVKTGDIETRVLGTAFNVEAWPDDTKIKVTVERGKVSVGDENHVFEELLPNEQLAVNTETDEFVKTKMDAEDVTEWKQSFFVLDKIAMEKAAEKISKRYGVEVTIENEGLKKCLVNGSFLDNESVEHIISVICLAMNADYVIEGEKIDIKGGIGCE